MSAAVVSPEAKRNHEALSPSHSPAAVAATTTTTLAAVPRSMEKKSVSRSPAAQVGGNGAPSVVVSATEESTSDVECVSPPHGAPALLGAAGRAAADGRSPVSATPSVAFAPSSSLMSKAVPTVDSGSSGAGTTATDTIAARPSAPKGGGKKMLQATLSFTDGHVEAQLRKDLGDRDARLEELQNKVRELESVLEGHEAARHDAELHIDELDQRLGRYKDTVKQLMIDVARTQRREARRWQHQQHFELGHIASTHNPISGVQEAWVNGNQWRRLNAALGDVHARQREVEASKKGAARPRVGSKAAAAADDDSSMLDVEEEAEMRRMEIAALKTQEQQIMMQLAQFEQDKEAFVKEVRRIHDEDSSPFALRETIGPIATAASDGNTSALLPQPLNSAPGAEKWQERYVLIQLLGRGGFSEVWKAFDLEEGRFVACKVHKVNRTWNHAAQKNYLKHAERELAIQQSLDHPRLMKLYDVFQMDSNTFVSVMEYGAGEDLEKRLKRCRQLREADAKLILMQILSALRHLSEQDQPVIHYDLKPANIIFHSPLPTCMEIKVTDFGLSKVIQDAAQGPSNDPSVELTSQQCGTFWYLPPECFSSGAKISHKVDIWAAGIIFYQMLYGVRPFAANASQADVFNQKLIVSAARKGVDFPAKPVVSDDAKKIITKCLTFDVAGRPDIFQLCADPYFHSRGKRPRATQAATLALPSQPNPGQPRPPQPSGLNDQMPPPS